MHRDDPGDTSNIHLCL